jgi:hypothetical protein
MPEIASPNSNTNRDSTNREEQVGLELPLGPQSSWGQLEVAAGLVLVSFVGFVLAAIYLWSVR